MRRASWVRSSPSLLASRVTHTSSEAAVKRLRKADCPLALPTMYITPGRPGLMYIVGHANGQSAFLSRFTAASELVCVTLLANKEGLDLTQLARRIAGAYDNRLGPP